MRRLRSDHVVLDLALALTTAFASPASGSVASPEQRSPTGQPIAKAPIDGRIGAGAVWTGDEMIVWEGVVRAGRSRPSGTGPRSTPWMARGVRSGPRRTACSAAEGRPPRGPAPSSSSSAARWATGWLGRSPPA
jgi:hypothetical protein